MPPLLLVSGVRLKPHLPQTCLFMYLESKPDYLFSLKLLSLWHAERGRKLLRLLFGRQRLCLKSKGRPQPAGPAMSPIWEQGKRLLIQSNSQCYRLTEWATSQKEIDLSLVGYQQKITDVIQKIAP